VSIVLECIPLPKVMEGIQAHLEKTIKDIPARKPTLKKGNEGYVAFKFTLFFPEGVSDCD
jgi:hypothetical protein